MKAATALATALILFGLALHSYIGLAKATSFSLGFWLWGLSPYLPGALLLRPVRQPFAAAGALVLPTLLDIANYHAVFIQPQSSTAALGMIFTPLWSLLLFAPLGAVVGWCWGRRMNRT